MSSARPATCRWTVSVPNPAGESWSVMVRAGATRVPSGSSSATTVEARPTTPSVTCCAKGGDTACETGVTIATVGAADAVAVTSGTIGLCASSIGLDDGEARATPSDVESSSVLARLDGGAPTGLVPGLSASGASGAVVGTRPDVRKAPGSLRPTAPTPIASGSVPSV